MESRAMTNKCFEIFGSLVGGDFNNRIDVKFNKEEVVTVQHIEALINDLSEVEKFWNNGDTSRFLNGGCLIQFTFNCVLSKSKRLKQLNRIIKFDNSSSSNMKMVGAKYVGQRNLKHAMTYFFEQKYFITGFKNSLERLKILISNKFGNSVNHNNFNFIVNTDLKPFTKKEDIIALLLEISRIENIGIPSSSDSCDKDKILTKFYLNPSDIIKHFKINALESSIVDNSVVLSKEDYELLIQEIPYLIVCGVPLYNNAPNEESFDEENLDIPPLGNSSGEPIVGVIDSGSDPNSYLVQKGWVEIVECRNKDYISCEDNAHGTEVDSLIVHGNDINSNKFINLDDYCGYFRVKHFSLLNEYNSTVEMSREIEKIVSSNYKEIKVWNLSIGSESEINNNFISPLSAKLDELQEKYNVIFVIAATNNKIKYPKKDNYKIGSPADSLNALVVGSVKLNTKTEASYSRKGGVLNYFIKPDVSYYGGDVERKIFASNGFRIVSVYGTSFAAPLVTRKVAYLVYKVGLSKELAKALIIDSACGWNNGETNAYIGRGVVPIDIKKVVNSSEDEIRFIFDAKVVKYYSQNFELPIPLDKNNKYPFIAKSTVCYFTKVTPSAGVDYTDVEVDCKIGPVVGKKIHSVKNDTKYMDGSFLNECDVRKELFKWDNTKFFMTEKNKTDSYKAKDVKANNKWGFNLITICRNDSISPSEKYGFNVGVVVTLKDVEGNNRSYDFFRLVSMSRLWNIKIIDIDLINKNSIELSSDIVWEK